MAGPKINLPPYDGSNEIELSEILIGSAADFRANLNSNTQEVANAVNLNTEAFALWTKAWVENIGWIYWEGLDKKALITPETEEDVGVISDEVITTVVPKLLNKYKVTAWYGEDETEVQFSNLYKDEDGAEVSYQDEDAGISFTIHSTLSEDRSRRSIIIINSSTAINVKITMKIDIQAVRAWYNQIEAMSKKYIHDITELATEVTTNFETLVDQKTSDFTSLVAEKTTGFQTLVSDSTDDFEELVNTSTGNFTDLVAEKTTGFETLVSTSTTNFTNMYDTDTSNFQTLVSDSTDDFEELVSTSTGNFTDLVTEKTTGFRELVTEKTTGFETLVNTSTTNFTNMYDTDTSNFQTLVSDSTGDFEELVETSRQGIESLTTTSIGSIQAIGDAQESRIDGLGDIEVAKITGQGEAEKDAISGVAIRQINATFVGTEVERATFEDNYLNQSGDLEHHYVYLWLDTEEET